MEKVRSKGHFITMGTLIGLGTIITPIIIQQFNRIHDKLNELSSKPYTTKNEVKELLAIYNKIEPTKLYIIKRIEKVEAKINVLEKHH